LNLGTLLTLWGPICVLPTANSAALPQRLVVAIDGVAYRDMKALQEGVTYTDPSGKRVHRQAFNEGYFPVSCNVSTFPSTSDVAWTDIFGDRPLPGYQRIYFSRAANSQLSVNVFTSTMEYERQMHCEVEGGFRRALSYVNPLFMFKFELRQMINGFLQSTNGSDTYYAYLRSTDDTQHLAHDIFAVLCTLDEQLKKLRACYRAREGCELEILILSDHGNNHGGEGQRVEVRSFLKKAGYRLTRTIASSKDVVLPTCGIESWVEIHNSPAETERLVQLLWRLKGVDVLTATMPGRTNQFIVMNSKGERATIEWNSVKNSFRYSPETGDPISYRPVLEALAQRNALDASGFASANAWMEETLTHRYPLALERIARAHTRVTLNPATILISLCNDFVHADWFIKKGSKFMKFGGTHGALDDLNSNGIVLSSFAPTTDTSTSRIAALFGGFTGRRDYRAEGAGADWVWGEGLALAPASPAPLDGDCEAFSGDNIFLRIWSPSFMRLPGNYQVKVTVEQIRRFSPARIRHGDSMPADPPEQRLTLHAAAIPSGKHWSCERVYALPTGLTLEPQKLYRISGRVCGDEKHTDNFRLLFRTDSRSRPILY